MYTIELNKTNLKNIIIVLFVFSENTIVEISRLQPFETWIVEKNTIWKNESKFTIKFFGLGSRIEINYYFAKENIQYVGKIKLQGIDRRNRFKKFDALIEL